jgi:hypothetical protein
MAKSAARRKFIAALGGAASCRIDDWILSACEYNRGKKLLKKRRSAAANRRLPVDFKALIRRRSELTLMNANNDSLSVRSASVSGSDAEGRPYEVRQSAKPVFFIWPRLNCGHYFLEVSSGNGGSVDKISSCGNHVTDPTGLGGRQLLTNLASL